MRLNHAHQNNINLEECTQSACRITLKRSLAAHRLSLDRSETHLKNLNGDVSQNGISTQLSPSMPRSPGSGQISLVIYIFYAIIGKLRGPRSRATAVERLFSSPWLASSPKSRRPPYRRTYSPLCSPVSPWTLEGSVSALTAKLS